MITEKQRDVINLIEFNLGIRFTGNTKEEATTFIGKHIETSKESSFKRRRDLLSLRFSEMREEENTMDGYYSNGWHNMPH